MSLPEKELQCPICFELPSDAVEARCCSVVLCSRCAQPLDRCPQCRHVPLLTTACVPVRRLVDRFLVECDMCGLHVDRGSTELHKRVCEGRPRYCSRCAVGRVSTAGERHKSALEPSMSSFKTAVRSEALKHLISTHADEVWQGFERITAILAVPDETPCARCGEMRERLHALEADLLRERNNKVRVERLLETSYESTETLRQLNYSTFEISVCRRDLARAQERTERAERELEELRSSRVGLEPITQHAAERRGRRGFLFELFSTTSIEVTGRGRVATRIDSDESWAAAFATKFVSLRKLSRSSTPPDEVVRARARMRENEDNEIHYDIPPPPTSPRERPHTTSVSRRRGEPEQPDSQISRRRPRSTQNRTDDESNTRFQVFSVEIVKNPSGKHIGLGVALDEELEGDHCNKRSSCVLYTGGNLYVMAEMKCTLPAGKIREGSVVSVLVDLSDKLLHFEVDGEPIYQPIKLEFTAAQLEHLRPVVDIGYKFDSVKILKRAPTHDTHSGRD